MLHKFNTKEILLYFLYLKCYLCWICRSIESLYEELVEQGVIKKVLDVRMSEYEGEYSYLGTTLRQANIEPMPSLGDVRRVVTEFGVLPLGKFHNSCNCVCIDPSTYFVRK